MWLLACLLVLGSGWFARPALAEDWHVTCENIVGAHFDELGLTTTLKRYREEPDRNRYLFEVQVEGDSLMRVDCNMQEGEMLPDVWLYDKARGGGVWLFAEHSEVQSEVTPALKLEVPLPVHPELEKVERDHGFSFWPVWEF